MYERKVYLTNLKNEIVKFVRENNVTLSSAKVEISYDELNETNGEVPYKFVLPFEYNQQDIDEFLSLLDFNFNELYRNVYMVLLFTDGSWAEREYTYGGIPFFSKYKRPNEFTKEDML